MQLSSHLNILWYYPSWKLGWGLTFSSPVATAGWVFQICWHIECNTLIASSFRVLNSSTGIPLHPKTLFTAVGLVPKAHLTSPSRMSGSGWLTTPSKLTSSLGSFWYSSSVYSFHLFLISSSSTQSLTVYVLYCAHLWVKCSLDISNFPEESSSLSPSVVFLFFFMHCSLKKAFLSLFAIL